MGAEEADYRVELYPPYHAHRDPMPPELRRQWAQAPALLDGLGWNHTTSEDLEADDVMFSLARIEAADGGSALLLTGDRDLFGAVDERVSVVELLKGGSHGQIGPADVRDRYGVRPDQVADFIALRGDPSDGLPGAPGIGAKTAAELLCEHDTLEGAIAAAQNRRQRADAPAHGRRPVENEQLLRTFKRDRHAPADRRRAPAGSPDRLRWRRRCARELGMRALAERLDKLATA